MLIQSNKFLQEIAHLNESILLAGREQYVSKAQCPMIG
jgi:hypothetical protein